MSDLVTITHSGDAPSSQQQPYDRSGRTIDRTPRYAAEWLANQINTECESRIYAIASDNAQKNMTANFVAGNMSAAEQQAYKDGVAWIIQMQLAARAMIAAQDPDYASDAKWPTCPPAAIALAEKY